MSRIKKSPVVLFLSSLQNLDRKSTTRDWLHKVDGAVIVYSVTDRNSFDIAEVVMDWLKKEKKPNQVIPMVLIGNKCDLEHSRWLQLRKQFWWICEKGGLGWGGGQSEHLFVEILFQQLINCKEYQILKLNNKCTHTTYHIIRVFN